MNSPAITITCQTSTHGAVISFATLSGRRPYNHFDPQFSSSIIKINTGFSHTLCILLTLSQIFNFNTNYNIHFPHFCVSKHQSDVANSNSDFKTGFNSIFSIIQVIDHHHLQILFKIMFSTFGQEDETKTDKHGKTNTLILFIQSVEG